VGAVTGVIGFLLVALVATRRGGRRRVVSIPPYATGVARVTPMPPSFAEPGLVPFPPRPRAHTPSRELSAEALAQMGIPIGPFGERVARGLSEDDYPDAASVDVEVARETVGGATVVLPPPPPPPRAPLNPLSVIKSSSSALRGTGGTPPSGSGVMPVLPKGAPIAELSFDDGATEIAETVFDEPPRPRTRSEPPKIRKIGPGAPRFGRRS
jgi:hypothetical protein